jgi:DNA-binding beta-propeller fold protein YncE
MHLRDSKRSTTFLVLTALALGLASVLLAPTPDAFGDTQIAPAGSAAGEVLEPSGLAVDPSDGTLYIADRGNRRVDVFDGAGEFIRAFGWGVVAEGPGNDPRNEIEEVGVAATGGSFTLLFVQNSVDPVGGPIRQETGFITFNAPASAVQTALEGLPAFGPGDLTVTGPTGGPWTIEFQGTFADMDLHELEEGSASELTGGLAELSISTTQEGGNYEVCEPEAGDICRAGQRGTMAGQLNPVSVAVDPSTHDVYVFDGLESSSTNEAPSNRVQKFTSEGDFLYMLGGGVNLDTGEDICTAVSGDTCGRGVKGSGTGEFNAERSSVAVGPSGILYVNDGGGVQKFDPSGSFLEEVAISGVLSSHLAVDLAGNIYVATATEIRKYNPAGTLQYALPVSILGAIALDSTDRLYVSDLSSGEFGISRYSSTGALEKVFYGVNGFRALTVAPNKEATGVFAVEDEGFEPSLRKVNLIPVPPLGPVVYPIPATVFADPIGNVRATLNARINPEGKATTFHYEYIEQQAFETEGGWSSPKVQETAESGSIGSDFLLHDAKAAIGCADPGTESSKCLTPETEYRFRVVAKNADGESFGPETTFETEPPVKFGPLFTTDVDTDSAVLHAEVNPFGFAAEGFFEYVDDVTYQSTGFATATKTPAGSPLDFGSGEAFVERSAPAAPLLPNTTYHYRLVVSNHCKPAEPSVVCTLTSPEETFGTFTDVTPPPCPANEAFREGVGSFLLDCRAYEMVSPVDKNGVNVEVVFNNPGYRAGLDQSGSDGDKISYSAYRAFADPEGAPYTSQYLAGRANSSWETESISLPREGPSLLFTFNYLDYQYKAFTEDLCSAWALQDTAKPLLAPGALNEFANLHRRDNCEPEAGSYEAITKVAPIGGGVEPSLFYPELVGFSADGSKTFFRVTAKLTSNSRKGIQQVYEVTSAGINPVCVLPEGSVTLPGCALGTGSSFGFERNASAATAVSDDGSVVYWTNDSSGVGPLYARIDGTETVQVSAQSSQFWSASSDGSEAIYTIGEKLFSFDLASKTSTQIAEGVKGLAGMSEDASRVYFASTKVLGSGATAGQANLYRYAEGSFQFIGTLSSEDLPPPSSRPSPVNVRPILRTARVAPDGERLVFMSRAPLTGYDNTDANSGEADSEVFLYDASAEGGDGDLLCISCNPSGARPNGQEWEIPPVNGGWAAAFIPGYTTQLYAPRVISEDGNRVFFNSFDALVARDQNKALDVYEWEAPGSGNCEEGGYAYVPSAGGCVNLISSGEDPQASEFLDASASGDDVFFKTYDSLVPQDPALVDIYDARVGGGFPNPPTPEKECEGEGCLPAPAPEPAHPTPQSQSFVGPGNQVAKPKPKPKKCPKGKHRVKRKGKSVCVKNKKAGKQNKSGRAGK